MTEWSVTNLSLYLKVVMMIIKLNAQKKHIENKHGVLGKKV